MIKLEDNLGLPVMLDNQSNTLVFDEDVTRVTNIRRYKVRNLRRYLLNNDLKYPEDIYITYSDIYNRDGIRPKYKVDVTIIPENLLGIEYTKTTPRRVLCKGEKYRIAISLYGSSNLIIQERKKFPQEIYLIKLEKNSVVFIPSGYHYQFINSRPTTAVVAEVYRSRIVQSRSLKPKRGMSYYMICKNAKQEIVQNPAYKHIADVKKLKSEEFTNIFFKHSNLIKNPIYSVLEDLNLKGIIV